MSKNIVGEWLGKLIGKGEEKVTGLGYDPRVIKLSYPESEYDTLDEETKKALFFGREGEMAACQILEEVRLKHIVDDLRVRFRGKEIGMRGIMTSLEGDLEIVSGENRMTVIELGSLLSEGCEKPGVSAINIAPMGDVEGVDEISHRAEQFLYSCIKHDIVPQADETRDRLFPALVIYDLGKGSPLKGLKRDGYMHQLPENAEDRGKIIMAVYPIDVRFMLPETNK